MIALDPVMLFDMGFGPYMVSVAPPGAQVSPSSTLKRKALGKIPARLTQAGWTGVDLNDPKHRCLDYATAKKWRDEWGANVGFVAGDGYAFLDNDQGAGFSAAIQGVFAKVGKMPIRRFVLDPKHHRDAFLFRVLDFVGDGVALMNQDITLRKGALAAKMQLLAQGKQAVISGTHPETKCPYVWDFGFAAGTIDDVPVMSEKEFGEFIRKLMADLAMQGWVSTAPVSAAVSGKPPSAPPNATQASASSAMLDDARALLATIPNREIPQGEKPNAIDDWLDPYENWVKVAYALAAHLGSGLARTPAAEALWCEWSDGRAQPRQSSADIWRSAVKQIPRYGEIGLLKLVKSIGALPPQGFPPPDPNDPLLKAAPTPVWDEIRARWAHFTPKGEFLDTSSSLIIPQRAFSGRYQHVAKELLAELRPGAKKRDKPAAADLFLERKDKLTVSGLIYAPGEPRFLPDLIDPAQHVFNLWAASDISPRKGVIETQIAPWLNHLEYVLGSTAERVRFVKWCAFVAQFPKEKPNWHYLVMGLSGLGKDSMLAPVKAAVGEGNFKEEVAQQINSTFNDCFQAKLLIVGETHQLKWDAQGMMGRLKQALARPPEHLWINQKYLPRYAIPNRIAAVMFSNETVPLPLEEGQRRIHVVNARKIAPKAQSYYSGLWDWLNHGGIELAAGYLLALPLTSAEKQDFSGGVAPQSDDKTRVESMNQPPALDLLDELIDDARKGTGPFALSSGLVTIDDITREINNRGVRQPSPQMVRGRLLDLEDRKQGVRRLRIDPAKPHQCGVVGVKGASARLWSLTDKAPDGRKWKKLSNAELLALWQGKPAPRTAKILGFPASPPENLDADDASDEMI